MAKPNGRIQIVAEDGCHLLIRCGSRFAVVERRVGRIYGMDSAHRQGFPNDQDGLRQAVGPDGWQEEAKARRTFAEIIERETDLARRML